mmetsp:Transcript_18201/g.43576  ORF Transcript_18201/g.43576 Transcript_18201/m.43576 type:complete len:268 (-) Transcript_18201:419-1222(-)
MAARYATGSSGRFETPLINAKSSALQCRGASQAAAPFGHHHLANRATDRRRNAQAGRYPAVGTRSLHAARRVTAFLARGAADPGKPRPAAGSARWRLRCHRHNGTDLDRPAGAPAAAASGGGRRHPRVAPRPGVRGRVLRSDARHRCRRQAPVRPRGGHETAALCAQPARGCRSRRRLPHGHRRDVEESGAGARDARHLQPDADQHAARARSAASRPRQRDPARRSAWGDRQGHRCPRPRTVSSTLWRTRFSVPSPATTSGRCTRPS